MSYRGALAGVHTLEHGSGGRGSARVHLSYRRAVSGVGALAEVRGGGTYDHTRGAYRGVCREHTARLGSVGLLGAAAQLHGTDLGAVQCAVVPHLRTGGRDMPRGQEKVQKT